MYAFLGTVSQDSARKGIFKPEFILGRNQKGQFVSMDMNEKNAVDRFGKNIMVVNCITDDTAQLMIKFMTEKAFNGYKYRHNSRLFLWYECDIYARRTGPVLLVDAPPEVTDEPSFENLSTVTRPLLVQNTSKTEKQKEKKKHEKLVC